MAGFKALKENEYLNRLISVGNDAMTNLYYLKFTGKIGDEAGITQALMVRAGDFQAPKSEQGNHTVDFLTVDSLMPSPEIKIDKQFDVTFRIDEDYNVYKYLLALQSATSIPTIGQAFTTTNQGDEPGEGLGLEVYAPGDASKMKATNIGSTGIPEDWDKIYEFDYLWIKKVTPPKFSYENPTALTSTATFGFFTFKDNLRGYEEGNS